MDWHGLETLLLLMLDLFQNVKQIMIIHISSSRDRLVVRTLRCGRSNPGSNPGHGSVKSLLRQRFFFIVQLNYSFNLNGVVVGNKKKPMARQSLRVVS
jgi:hypothetical protein